MLHRVAGYRIKSKIFDRREKKDFIDSYYWPDEIKDQVLRYPYICIVEKEPFLVKEGVNFPYVKLFSEATWESFRSCMLHKEYREISSLDFLNFVSLL